MINKSMNQPLITIGIATFNASKTIEGCIQSALQQSWGKIEIVIVDDCSQDSTIDILFDLAKDNKVIKVFKNEENFGIGFVRNRIIKEAKGEFLAFFDDDDYSYFNRLEIQYNKIIDFEKNNKSNLPVICHSSRKVIFPNGRISLYPTMGTDVNSNVPNGLPVAKRILLGYPLKNGYGSCPTCSQMARLSAYKMVSGFDANFRRAEDTDLIIRFAFIGAYFIGIETPLVEQRMTLTSDKSIDIDFKYIFLLIKKYKFFIEKNGNYKFCRLWLKIKYYFSRRMFLIMFTKLIFVFLKYPLETFKRLIYSVKNIKLNNDFASFHSK